MPPLESTMKRNELAVTASDFCSNGLRPFIRMLQLSFLNSRMCDNYLPSQTIAYRIRFPLE